MQKGKVININSTKYIVECDHINYDCILRGVFRKDNNKVIVGDYVEIDENKLTIEKVYERKNELNRPQVANTDYAVILTSTKKPDLDLYLLDKLLVNVINNKIKPIICFSKIDLLNEEELNSFNKIKAYYEKIGIITILNTEVNKFKEIIKNKIVVLCGQTGAGKSSFINKIDSSLDLKTNPISESLNRGVHTTRYVSLYEIEDFYIADTPGFSSLSLENLTDEQIRNAFIEFNNYNCKYKDCSHINTDGCEVISYVNDKDILISRYENYQKMLKEKHEGSSKFFKK